MSHPLINVTDWRKSSYSDSNGGDCVEWARRQTTVAVRDSKDPGGPALAFSPAAWATFVDAVKTDRFPV